jgi:plastocyanin
MAKGLLIAFTTFLVASAVVLVVFMGMMMATMMGSGHMAMMSGAGSDPSKETPVEAVTDVRIENFAFAPANIVVDVGTTVTWTNDDVVPHTVTSDDGDELDSELLNPGDTFSHTFDTPGEYRYHCTPHPNMQGLVTVR